MAYLCCLQFAWMRTINSYNDRCSTLKLTETGNFFWISINCFSDGGSLCNKCRFSQRQRSGYMTWLMSCERATCVESRPTECTWHSSCYKQLADFVHQFLLIFLYLFLMGSNWIENFCGRLVPSWKICSHDF